MKKMKSERTLLIEEYQDIHTKIYDYIMSAHNNHLYELAEMLSIIIKDLERWYVAYEKTQVTHKDFHETMHSFEEHAYHLACNYQIECITRHQ